MVCFQFGEIGRTVDTLLGASRQLLEHGSRDFVVGRETGTRHAIELHGVIEIFLAAWARWP